MAVGYRSAVELTNVAKAARNALSTRTDRFARAWRRVHSSPRMRGYADIILNDGWASDDDHLRWVIRGKVGEIVGWAEQIRRDSDE